MNPWREKGDSEVLEIWKELETNLVSLAVNLQKIRPHILDLAELEAETNSRISCPSALNTIASNTTKELDRLLRSMDYRSLSTLDFRDERIDK